LPSGTAVVIIPLMTKWAATVCLTASLAIAGCVERELYITSQPEGALVYVSDVEVGRTPVVTPFTWYGDYEIILRMEGHKTIKDHVPIRAKWYELIPLDLLSELAPWKYRDRRELSYSMVKLVQPTDAELIERAEEMKKKNLEPVEPPPR
jgi:hypothetical protein